MLPKDTFERFATGDAQAFAQIVRAFDGLVRSVARLCFHGGFEQEEAMQEVWLHVFNNRGAFDLERFEQFPAWLSVVARRKCTDILRKRRPDTSSFEEIADSVPADEEDARAVIERRALMAAVASFEERLKPAWRAFFRLCFVEGCAYPEIEARLGYGALRCKYMKKVLAAKARKNRALLQALGRWRGAERAGGHHAR